MKTIVRLFKIKTCAVHPQSGMPIFDPMEPQHTAEPAAEYQVDDGEFNPLIFMLPGQRILFPAPKPEADVAEGTVVVPDAHGQVATARWVLTPGAAEAVFEVYYAEVTLSVIHRPGPRSTIIGG